MAEGEEDSGKENLPSPACPPPPLSQSPSPLTLLVTRCRGAGGGGSHKATHCDASWRSYNSILT